MITLKPFRPFIVHSDKAACVSCPPYDVLDTKEAQKYLDQNPHNFLSVTHSEVYFPNENPYTDKVYNKGKENLESLIEQGFFIQYKTGYFIYEETREGKIQTGLLGLTSIYDYEKEVIKKHELTRVDKELDRINHFYTCKSNTEPIFLFHKKNQALTTLINAIKAKVKPIIDFVDENNVQHKLYPISNQKDINEVTEAFKHIDALYIADGHHRCASAYKVGKQMKEQNPNHNGTEPYNYNMAVIFPEEQLHIMPYNRLILDVGVMTIDNIISQLSKEFKVNKLISFQEPAKPKTFTLSFNKEYYSLEYKNINPSGLAEENLDASIIQRFVLKPIFHITDPRTDRNLKFFGGKTMFFDMEKNSTSNSLGIYMYATTTKDITVVSDNKGLMPPKSTWFEPKLRSGLFFYKF